MSLTLQTKKQITQDWLKIFPEMNFYKPMWLMKRNGPILIGVCLEIVLGNTAYRPSIHIHNLCRPVGIVSLTLWNPLRNKSNTFQTITFKNHGSFFENAAINLRQQSILPISFNQNLSEILSAYERYLTFDMPSSKFPLFIYEEIISLLVLCNKRTYAIQKLNKFLNLMSNWMPTVFDNVGGFYNFRNKLNTIIEMPPDNIREICDAEIKLLKLNKLPDLGFNCE